MNKERLKAAAIEREGVVVDRGVKSHYQLRAALDPGTDPNLSVPGDIEGFITTAGRFLTRAEAIPVAIEAGQLNPMWKNAKRPLLSSDLNW